MYEIKLNLHIHSLYSDGSKSHLQIISDAAGSGLDAIIFTDHNIVVEGIEGYHQINGREILAIMGEEIHNPNAIPQKNHLLALGINQDLAFLADNRSKLIEEIHDQQGAAFLAHPYDPALPNFNEPDISWEDWTIKGYDGIELWNGFSELKVRAKSKLAPYIFAFFPKLLPLSPPQETLSIWNDLHRRGQKVAAIGGSDAHAITFTAGPLKRVIFPYLYHFSAINNHVLIDSKLQQDFQIDKHMLISAIKNGSNFISNDLIEDAYGFRFTIEDQDGRVLNMGKCSSIAKHQMARIHLPNNAEIRLIKDGHYIEKNPNAKILEYPISKPGIYRVECYRWSRGRKRAWIISNPIYIT